MTGAILLVTVPATINRAAWRGGARKSSMPNRAMSYRAAAVAIISMAQQASPEPNSQREFFWAQVMNLSALTRRKGDFSIASLIAPPKLQGAGPPGIDVAEEEEDEGQEVETDRGGLAGRGGGRLDAAFVRLALVADGAAAVADEGDEAEEPDREGDRDDKKEKEIPEILHVRRPRGAPLYDICHISMDRSNILAEAPILFNRIPIISIGFPAVFRRPAGRMTGHLRPSYKRGSRPPGAERKNDVHQDPRHRRLRRDDARHRLPRAEKGPDVHRLFSGGALRRTVDVGLHLRRGLFLGGPLHRLRRQGRLGIRPIRIVDRPCPPPP